MTFFELLKRILKIDIYVMLTFFFKTIPESGLSLIPLLRYLPLDQAQNSCQYEYSSLHHIASFAQAGIVARDLSTGVLFLFCIGPHPNRSMPNMFRNKMMVIGKGMKLLPCCRPPNLVKWSIMRCISEYSPLHFAYCIFTFVFYFTRTLYPHGSSFRESVRGRVVFRRAK